MSYNWGAHPTNRQHARRPRWRDRSDTAWMLRWWRARIAGYLHMRGRRRC
jgi:hypothetical protein